MYYKLIIQCNMETQRERQADRDRQTDRQTDQQTETETANIQVSLFGLWPTSSDLTE